MADILDGFRNSPIGKAFSAETDALGSSAYDLFGDNSSGFGPGGISEQIKKTKINENAPFAWYAGQNATQNNTNNNNNISNNNLNNINKKNSVDKFLSSLNTNNQVNNNPINNMVGQNNLTPMSSNLPKVPSLNPIDINQIYNQGRNFGNQNIQNQGQSINPDPFNIIPKNTMENENQSSNFMNNDLFNKFNFKQDAFNQNLRNKSNNNFNNLLKEYNNNIFGEEGVSGLLNAAIKNNQIRNLMRREQQNFSEANKLASNNLEQDNNLGFKDQQDLRNSFFENQRIQNQQDDSEIKRQQLALDAAKNNQLLEQQNFSNQVNNVRLDNELQNSNLARQTQLKQMQDAQNNPVSFKNNLFKEYTNTLSNENELLNLGKNAILNDPIKTQTLQAIIDGKIKGNPNNFVKQAGSEFAKNNYANKLNMFFPNDNQNIATVETELDNQGNVISKKITSKEKANSVAKQSQKQVPEGSVVYNQEKGIMN